MEPVYFHTRYHLQVDANPEALSVVSFSANEHLSCPYEYHITFTSPAADIAVDTLLNQTATLTFNAPPVNTFGVLPQPQPLRQVHGVVRSFSGQLDNATETV